VVAWSTGELGAAGNWFSAPPKTFAEVQAEYESLDIIANSVKNAVQNSTVCVRSNYGSQYLQNMKNRAREI
jgi:hypothetical protein